MMVQISTVKMNSASRVLQHGTISASIWLLRGRNSSIIQTQTASVTLRETKPCNSSARTGSVCTNFVFSREMNTSRCVPSSLQSSTRSGRMLGILTVLLARECKKRIRGVPVYQTIKSSESGTSRARLERQRSIFKRWNTLPSVPHWIRLTWTSLEKL